MYLINLKFYTPHFIYLGIICVKSTYSVVKAPPAIYPSAGPSTAPPIMVAVITIHT